jgi:hypothetical protein
MGITSPLGQLAVGTAQGAKEAATEAIGGIGGRLLPAMRGLKGVAQNVAVEAGEEVLAGRAGDAINVGAGQFVSDPQRPGFTTTGYELPSLNPFTPENLARAKQEALGGAAGGAVFAGMQALSPSQDLPVSSTPPLPVSPSPSLSPSPLPGIAQRAGTVDVPPLVPGLEAEDVQDVETGRSGDEETANPPPAPPPRQPILTNVPDAVMSATPTGLLTSEVGNSPPPPNSPMDTPADVQEGAGQRMSDPSEVMPVIEPPMEQPQDQFDLEPLGANRFPASDPLLEQMDEDAFRVHLKQANQALDAQERKMDEQPQVLENPAFRRQLARLQDAYSAAELEKVRRQAARQDPGDVFVDFTRLAETLDTPDE